MEYVDLNEYFETKNADPESRYALAQTLVELGCGEMDVMRQELLEARVSFESLYKAMIQRGREIEHLADQATVDAVDAGVILRRESADFDRRYRVHPGKWATIRKSTYLPTLKGGVGPS
jgi:hypothetical protein